MRCFGRNREDGCLALVLSSATAMFCLPVPCSSRSATLRGGGCGSRGTACCSCAPAAGGGAGVVRARPRRTSRILRLRCVSDVLWRQGSVRCDQTAFCVSQRHAHATCEHSSARQCVVHGRLHQPRTLKQTLEFADWFASQPHKVKICVPGNHDMIMDKDYWREFWSDWTGPSSRGSHSEAMDAFKDRGIRVLIDRALYLRSCQTVAVSR